jgi:hypothetical protein
MNNPPQDTIVFVGTHSFTFELPSTAEVEEGYEIMDVPGFEAVCTFRHLQELQAADEPAFTHAQVVCVSEVEDYDFRSGDFASVLVLPEAVRWILCFPVVRVQGVHYALRTNAVPPDGDDVFYSFASAAPAGTPVQAVPDLDSLMFLSPQPGDKLAVIRANDWDWNDGRNTAFIRLRDVLEIEFVSESEVRVL